MGCLLGIQAPILIGMKKYVWNLIELYVGCWWWCTVQLNHENKYTIYILPLLISKALPSKGKGELYKVLILYDCETWPAKVVDRYCTEMTCWGSAGYVVPIQWPVTYLGRGSVSLQLLSWGQLFVHIARKKEEDWLRRDQDLVIPGDPVSCQSSKPWNEVIAHYLKA